MAHTQTTLPKDAEIALLEYLKCDSIETLSDCILPTSVADEMKQGKLQQANYYFAGFPYDAYTDVKISGCSLMSLKLVKHYAEFLAESVSMQGVPADFTAEKGYDVIVSATYQFEHEAETIKFRATNRVFVMKIVDDRWIIMTAADPETNKMERIR